ncbi:hypothetical protein HYH02_006362 [Chlamydomonas schloesseri]|uniref:EF-hand domain-containing protein n=1 Tax=Chlamydomonas schloesseri TaxID=2026947 RepID=A0A835WKF9_9CHLO|nr:hypothetical protein HYH02_006362 [Chlamydomonas schloesseri]|eukprot:KAG2448470.1 hypothetical protein HYH02_006362 [Chlamydomonas schloesseri]
MATKGDVEQPSKDLKVDVPDGERSSPSGGNQITLERFNTPTRNVLKKFDDNGDGRIDANEIQAVVSTLVAEKFKSKAFKIGLIILGVFTIILLGAMFGLTWAVVAALKDTQVNDSGVMTTNDGASTPVLTANLDMTVSADGKLVSRASNSTIATTPAVVTSLVSSEAPFSLLMKLQSLVFVGPDGSQYSVEVMGVARIPKTTGGHEVRFQTASGILVLENKSEWHLVNATGSMLDGLFKPSSAGRRRLLEDGVKTLMRLIGGEALPCPNDFYGIAEDECDQYELVETSSPPPPPSPSPPPSRPPPPPPKLGTGEEAVNGADCGNGDSGPQTSCAAAMAACNIKSSSDITTWLAKDKCGVNCNANKAWSLVDVLTTVNGITAPSGSLACKTSSSNTITFCC